MLRRHFCGPFGGLNYLSHIPELFVPPLQQIINLASLQILKRLADVLLKIVRRRVGVAVSAAKGFGNDRVDYSQLDEMLARELQRLSQLTCPFIALEQNRATRLRRNH